MVKKIIYHFMEKLAELYIAQKMPFFLIVSSALFWIGKIAMCSVLMESREPLRVLPLVER